MKKAIQLGLISILISATGCKLWDGPFLIGGNMVDWSCTATSCNYGHDIGTNGWQTIYMPTYENKANFQRANWDKMMTDLASANANAARIPLMTEGQGILWDPSGKKITGPDPAWIENVSYLLRRANDFHLKVEIGLLTGNTPKTPNVHTFFYGKRQILKDPDTQMDYLNLVIKPLILAIKNEPALVGVDVFGEADGALTENAGDVSEEDIRAFTRNSVQLIRSLAPDLKLTASTGYWQHVTPAPIFALLHGLGLDYYEVHLYNMDGMIQNCSRTSPNPELPWSELDLPVLLGEFGMAHPVDGDKDGSASRALAKTVIANFLKNAKACGLVGALFWAASPGPSLHPESDRFQNLYTQDGVAKPEILDVLRSANP